MSHRREGTRWEGYKGNLPFQKTEVQSEFIRVNGAFLTQAQMAIKLGISEDTIQRHFKEEMAEATANTAQLIGSKMVNQALDGCRTSQIFWLKCKGGWRQTSQIDVKANGATVQLDLSGLTEDQLRAAIPIFELLASSGAGAGSEGEPDGHSAPDQTGAGAP